MSMMGSSKYEFEPELFEEDIESKMKIYKQFEEDLKDVIYNEYRYSNNQPMSDGAKREILLRVHREFWEKI